MAWVLAARTELPMVAVEKRQAGSRQRFWIRRHVAVDMLDGRLLDIAGAVAVRDMERRVASSQSSRTRPVALTSPTWRNSWTPTRSVRPRPAAQSFATALSSSTGRLGGDGIVRVGRARGGCRG